MTQAQFIVNIINDKSAAIEKSWCDEIFAEYPYFHLPLILYLQRNGSHISQEIKNEITGRIAIGSPDRKALYSLIGSDKDRFTSFYPAEKPATPDTDTTIDTFIKTFGNANEKEIDMLNRLIFNPVPDYSQILASEEKQDTGNPVPNDTEISDNDILINKFIALDNEKQGGIHAEKTPQDAEQIPAAENATATSSAPGADSMLSESLAKIYIKQHKYEKALEIIKSISLKFPEKSIYFADQIRFLQKLIINEQFKSKN